MPWFRTLVKSASPSTSSFPSSPESASKAKQYPVQRSASGGTTGSSASSETLIDTISSSESSSRGHTFGKSSKRHVATGYIAAKEVVMLVKESADVFPPLKSVAGGLVYLINHFEKWISNKETAQKLAGRLNSLNAEFNNNTDALDEEERIRCDNLMRKLKVCDNKIKEISADDGFTRLIRAGEEASFFLGLIQEINHAIMDYQLSSQRSIYQQVARLSLSNNDRALQELLLAREASHIYADHNPCLPGTRTQVIQEIEKWLDDPRLTSAGIFWLKGHAGSGKSAIAQSFCQRAHDNGRLGASFFCSRDFQERSNLHYIFPAIAFQLASKYPSFKQRLLRVLNYGNSTDQIGKSLVNQLRVLIVDPLRDVHLATTIAIDAIDECKDEEAVSAILSVLASQIDQIPTVKFFITGRPEVHIRAAFRDAQLRKHSRIFELDSDVSTVTINKDIDFYIRTSLFQRLKHRSDPELSENWPSDEEVQTLVSKSSGLFIFAVTAVAFICYPHESAATQLAKIVDSPNISLPMDQPDLDSRLDVLYGKILEEGYGRQTSQHLARFRSVLGCIIVAFYPLSKETIAFLLKRSIPDISSSIRFLHSVVHVPETRKDPIRIYHQSFAEYITANKPKRCQHEKFFIDVPMQHRDLAIGCLRIMQESLKKNICHVGFEPHAPRYVMNETIRREDREKCIGSALEYACRFWTKHLLNAVGTGAYCDDLQELVNDFVVRRLVFWFEALSLLNDLGSAIYSLKELEESLHHFGNSGTNLIQWITDGQQLLLTFFDCIKESASHLYHTALPLSPKSSLMRLQYERDLEKEVKVLVGLDDHWEQKPRTIKTGLSHLLKTVFSHDGRMLVAVGKPSAELFDANKGESLATFTVANCYPISFAFSPNALLLVSSWSDKMIRLWDLQTGCLVNCCNGPQTNSWNVAFSSSGTKFASGDEAGCIHVWDTLSGRLERTIRTQPGTGVTVSCHWISNGNTLISYTGRGIEKWNVSSGSWISNFTSYGETNHRAVSSIAETTTGPVIICKKQDTIEIYDAITYSLLQSIQHPDFRSAAPVSPLQRESWIKPACKHIMSISPDKHNLALPTGFGRLQLFDISSTGAMLSTTLLHGEEVTSIAFSPDSTSMVLSGWNGNFSIAKVESLKADDATVPKEGCNASISCVCISSDGKLCATGFQDGTAQIWDGNTGRLLDSWIVKDLTGRRSGIKAMGFSHQKLARRYLGIVLTEQNRSSFGEGHSVDVWNTEKRKVRHLKEPGLTPIKDLSFLDDRLLFGLSEEFIEVWDAVSGNHLHSIFCSYKLGRSSWTPWIECSASGVRVHRRLSSRAQDRRLWEANTNKSPNQLASITLQEIHDKPLASTPYKPYSEATHPVVGSGDWIVNHLGQKILWIPHKMRIEFSSPKGSKKFEGEEKYMAKWSGLSGRKLILAGQRGRTVLLSFSGVDVLLPSPEHTLDLLGYRGTSTITGLRRDMFLERKKL